VTRGAFALILVFALLAAAPAGAAPPWEPPREPTTVGCKCAEPWQLAFGESGRALAVVRSGQGAGSNPIVATRTRGGAWNQVVPPVVGDAQLGVHDDRALLFGIHGTYEHARAKLATGDTRGRFGKPRNYGPAVRFAFAVDPSGAAAATWSRPDGALFAIRRGPRRSRGWRYSKPIRIGLGGIALATAVNARGEAVVMSPSSKGVVVTPIDAKGALRKRAVLGRSQGTDTYGIGLAASGRWVAAWQTHTVTRTGASPNYDVMAFRGSIRTTTVKRAALDSYVYGGGVAPQSIRVTMDSTGRPIVAWSSAELLTGPYSGTRQLVRVAGGGSDGRLGEPQTIRLEDEGALLADLETGPDGRAVLLWNTDGVKIGGEAYQYVPRQLHALYRAGAGQAFGPDESIDTLNDGAGVAFDPLSGRALAIWDTLRESFRG
jgi:hypothetical protein